MKDPYSIIKRPLITEKSMGIAPGGKYAFEVDINSNKIEIAYAVNKIFSVDVLKVNTLRVKGKAKKLGRYPGGSTPSWKKAYVTVKAGQRIDVFEGA